MIKLAVSGCQGRMGQRITLLALDDKDFDIHTLLENKNHPKANEKFNNIPVSTNFEDLAGNDILIEFTTPEATITNLKKCVENNVKMVIGTTGLSEGQLKEIKAAAEKIALVCSSNMSVGVNITFKLTQQLSEATPESYKVRITEAHHIHKVDAPSGTAKTLVQKVENGSAHKVDNIDSIREGEIIGDHDVIFESPVDVITIKHHAKTRDIFAKGALIAAKYLADKPNGLYDMQDVLGLK
ncbi:MAG: 4-hydroxy-tetrahydrodipicolinate reductase [Candidatus Omnitrophica bacterium]|nr:4-hydroxy-tetrahydrodipicolinate reductase [Candidatus Omnitrophota bacterium]